MLTKPAGIGSLGRAVSEMVLVVLRRERGVEARGPSLGAEILAQRTRAVAPAERPPSGWCRCARTPSGRGRRRRRRRSATASPTGSSRASPRRDPGAGAPATAEARGRTAVLPSTNRHPSRRSPRPLGQRFELIARVEAVGIEPTSGNPWRQASTSIADFLLLSLPGPPTGWISGRPAPKDLAPHPGAGIGASHQNMAPVPGPC